MPEIKKRTPHQALEYLFYAKQKSAKVFYKAIKSAVDSAKSVLKVNEDLLQFNLLTVEQGSKIKRFMPGGRGTQKPFVRRQAHIKIILTAKPQAELPVEKIERKVKRIEKK